MKLINFWSFTMDYESNEIIVNTVIEEEKIQLRLTEKDVDSMKNWFDLAKGMKNHK